MSFSMPGFAILWLMNCDYSAAFVQKIHSKVLIRPNTRSSSVSTKISIGDESTWSERDKSWLSDANRIDYVFGTTPAFGSLETIGLNISSELSARTIIPHHLTSPSDLFCNRELNMDQIEAIGFDMDWTLAQYNEAFDMLAFDGATEKLVSWLGYPKEVQKISYSQKMYRRGCVIDKRRGNILKLDRHKYVRYAEHGLTPLSRDQRKTSYRQSHQEILDMSGPNYVNIDTPFSLVDACLFAQLVDLKDRLSPINPFFASKTYENLWTDLRRCVDRCHKDGVIKQTVARAPEKYITYDPNIFPMLDGFRKVGRKVFLLTNSLWDYTNVVMNYLESRKVGAEKNLDWTKHFDLVIVGGNKPAFLEDEKSLALFRLNEKDETLQNIDSLPPTAEGIKDFLSQGKFFQGGNAQMLHKMLGITAGNRLLYVGDHMYADILRSKRTLGWRTCLIVPELTGEIITYKKRRKERTELLNLRREQFLLEGYIDEISAGTGASTMSSASGITGTQEEAEQRLEVLRQLITEKLDEYSRTFHPRWGPLFKAGFQESRFALQVMDYACMYTSRASNLGLVSPQRPFRPVRDKMPHDHFLEGL